MVKMSKQSKLAAEEVIKRSVDFFGIGGVGLGLISLEEGCARFEGGGGFVFIQTCGEEQGSQVDIEGREWDAQIEKFLSSI